MIGKLELAVGFCLLGLASPALENNQGPELDHKGSRPGEVINFSLLDYNGKYYELRRADAKVVVLFFTGNGCPIARQCISKLRALRSKFSSQGVVFWMINANAQDDRQSIAEEASEFKVGSLPILMDQTQGVAEMLGVKRTAEAIAINTKDWTIFYHGAIDDQLVEGAQKPKPTEKYLENALTEFLAGQEITVGKTATKGCLIHFEPGNARADAPVSYAQEIAPLLQRKCVSCHSAGNIGSWGMSSYKKVKGMSDMIKEVVLARRMPPWHADPHYGRFQNDRTLTFEESRSLLRWIEQGAPRGEGEDPLIAASAQAEQTAGWHLGKPDFVISLPAPQEVPATGVLQYRYVDAEFEVPHDMWLRAAVVRPGNRKVVHHVIVRLKSSEEGQDISADEVFLTSWAPGNMSLGCPDGTGKFLPKGAKFRFELHYNTIGKPEKDRSEIGLYVMSEPPKMILQTRGIETKDFSISPGEADSRSFALYCFKRDTLIYDLVPHMHLRGSWFKFEALLPDGKRETLLSVPHYDFNWQTEYRLVEPKRVTAGTWLLCTGAHDNSRRNPLNPDPTKRVKHGLQSFEEMFIGFMDVAEVPQPGEDTHKQARADKPAAASAQ